MKYLQMTSLSGCYSNFGKYCAFRQPRKIDAPKTLMLQVVQSGWCLASRDLSLEPWFIIVIDSKLLVLMEVDDHPRLQSNYDGDRATARASIDVCR
jgi:hypothetical protein